MAKDELRVAGILSVCMMAAIAGVVWGQVLTPPTPPQELADEAETRADWYEDIAENAEGTQTPAVNEIFEELAQERENEARAREAEVPAGG